MMNFKFNDKMDIENKISNSYVNQENPEETIRELSRYNHHVLNLDKEDSYDAILEYMTRNCRDFYEEKYFQIIYRNIASAKKYKFRNVAPVVITKAEIDKIYSLNDIRKEKIAFVLLAVAKYYNNVSPDNNNRMYMSISDLFKLSRVAIPCTERASYLNFAYKDGLLAEHMFVGTNLKIVSFVSDDSAVVMTLHEDDYRELAYTYLNYKSGGYKRCKNCGKLFKKHKSAPGQLYCKDCAPSYELVGLKKMKCVDCGEDFVVDARNTNKCRCDCCQHERDVELNRIASRERMKKYRER